MNYIIGFFFVTWLTYFDLIKCSQEISIKILPHALDSSSDIPKSDSFKTMNRTNVDLQFEYGGTWYESIGNGFDD